MVFILKFLFFLKLYRIAKKEYIKDLSGEGARIFGGRWNKKGFSMLYFSESLSLAVLEVLVHVDFRFLNSDFKYIEVEISDDLIKPKVKQKTLHANWRDNPPTIHTQAYGTSWLQSKKSLAIQVPSAILPQQHNVLINPKHEKIKHLKIIKTDTLNIDPRVFKTT